MSIKRYLGHMTSSVTFLIHAFKHPLYTSLSYLGTPQPIWATTALVYHQQREVIRHCLDIALCEMRHGSSSWIQRRDCLPRDLGVWRDNNAPCTPLLPVTLWLAAVYHVQIFNQPEHAQWDGDEQKIFLSAHVFWAAIKMAALYLLVT